MPRIVTIAPEIKITLDEASPGFTLPLLSLTLIQPPCIDHPGWNVFIRPLLSPWKKYGIKLLMDVNRR